MPGPTCAPTTAPTSPTVTATAPPADSWMRAGQRIRAVGIGQVLDGDVGRAVTDTLDRELFESCRGPWTSCAPSRAVSRAHQPDAAAASPTAPIRRARPPCRSGHHAAGTRGCRRRTARTPHRSDAARSLRLVAASAPSAAACAAASTGKPSPMPDRPAVDDTNRERDFLGRQLGRLDGRRHRPGQVHRDDPVGSIQCQSACTHR